MLIDDFRVDRVSTVLGMWREAAVQCAVARRGRVQAAHTGQLPALLQALWNFNEQNVGEEGDEAQHMSLNNLVKEGRLFKNEHFSGNASM